MWEIPGVRKGFLAAFDSLLMELRNSCGVVEVAKYPSPRTTTALAWCAGLGVSAVCVDTGRELLVGVHNEHLSQRALVLAKAKLASACGVTGLTAAKAADVIDAACVRAGFVFVSAAWHRDHVEPYLNRIR